MRDGKEKAPDYEPERQRPRQPTCRIRYSWPAARENADWERGLHLPRRQELPENDTDTAKAVSEGGAREKHGRGADRLNGKASGQAKCFSLSQGDPMHYTAEGEGDRRGHDGVEAGLGRGGSQGIAGRASAAARGPGGEAQ